MQKIVAALIVAMLALTLVGCGGGARRKPPPKKRQPRHRHRPLGRGHEHGSLGERLGHPARAVPVVHDH